MQFPETKIRENIIFSRKRKHLHKKKVVNSEVENSFTDFNATDALGYFVQARANIGSIPNVSDADKQKLDYYYSLAIDCINEVFIHPLGNK